MLEIFALCGMAALCGGWVGWELRNGVSAVKKRVIKGSFSTEAMAEMEAELDRHEAVLDAITDRELARIEDEAGADA